MSYETPDTQEKLITDQVREEFNQRGAAAKETEEVKYKDMRAAEEEKLEEKKKAEEEEREKKAATERKTAEIRKSIQKFTKNSIDTPPVYVTEGRVGMAGSDPEDGRFGKAKPENSSKSESTEEDTEEEYADLSRLRTEGEAARRALESKKRGRIRMKIWFPRRRKAKVKMGLLRRKDQARRREGRSWSPARL
jgi:hypothetical protein